ncbi:vWA domain-containing protein [Actinomyces howellii]|uniref:Uncharacterized protein conserved in bacteria n=1 Tax=Actinomyces howellii TaxID=52771 RepID=A0A448HJF4_9ACTO|nr:hypothetical protein [Actinomyces howellii]VEG29758.1 Uncharacterized protein conserved in bacteria [Actinomyces howellii]
MTRSTARANPAARAYDTGLALLRTHPVFRGLVDNVHWIRRSPSPCPASGWLVLERTEAVYAHPKRLADPQQWAQVMARALLVHAMEMWRPDRGDWQAWSAACDVVTTRFVHGLKLGRAPEHMVLPGGLPIWDEERWYRQFCETGIPQWATLLSLAGPGHLTMEHPGQWRHVPVRHCESWSEEFAAGIAESVSRAVEVAAGLREGIDSTRATAPGPRLSLPVRRARDWFISSFPLLGSMVASFTVLEDAEVCRREEIAVAAVDEQMRTIYLNPTAGLSTHELRFVIAHEVLHVALRHDPRRLGRDPFLWNAACDFVVNDWLIQMEVGVAPSIGLLHDAELRGLSAEEVYDRLTLDIRRQRRLRTLAGRQGDILDRRIGPVEGTVFTDLDAFCREQLGKGLLLHQSQGRGLLPAGLLEEINAVLQPPIPWEVRLARWFDHHFPPVETHRSWARLSRRQSATPDIPRPHVAVDPSRREGRTFGVVLDTSGSMDRRTLALALGSIAGYAEAKEVPAVRVVCCDAAPYDLGYLPAGDIAARVQVQGRGGTVLQPGITLLENAEDFPADGPILVITDGACDVLSIRREHAFLMPRGCRLPFNPRGEVFEMG